MKQVILDIPDEKYSFFMELINTLGFVESKEFEIPEEQMALVEERAKRSEKEPGRLLDWDKVKDDFEFD